MTNEVRCIDCTRLRLRENPKMAALGFGQCERKPAWEFSSVTFARQCDRFMAERADKVQARVDWYEKRGNK